MPKTFIVSDESVNTYGSRVLTAGIQLEHFQKNPIMLWNHMRNWRGTTDEVLPIGIWNNLKKTNKAMTADEEIDRDDEFALRIANKVDKGHIRAASIGIRIVETSEDPKLMLKGQTRPTITKCELREISIVDIPSNKNSVCLYDIDGNEIELSDGPGGPLPLLKFSDQNKPVEMASTTLSELAIVAATLGLPSEASASEVQTKIVALKSLATENEALKLQVAEYQEKEKAIQKEQGTALFNAALEAGKVTEDQRASYLDLFASNFDSTKAILEGMQPKLKLRQIPKSEDQVDAEATHNGKTFDQLRKDDPSALAALKSSDIEKFKAMYKAEYGTEYRG